MRVIYAFLELADKWTHFHMYGSPFSRIVLTGAKFYLEKMGSLKTGLIFHDGNEATK